MHRRSFLSVLAALTGASLLIASDANSQIIDLSDAINKAGRQRMLCQRAAKSYLAIGQSVLGDFAERVLDASMALFDRQLVELKAFSRAPEIQATYGLLEEQWGIYKTALVGRRPDRERADEVMTIAGRVLQLANQGTTQYEALSGKTVGHLVNVSGRQRMLSQRMAALFLEASWGVQSKAAELALVQTKDEFLKAHQFLKAAPESTPQIRSSLELVEVQFQFFDGALNSLVTRNAEGLQSKANVFTTSERILEVMDGVTGMYSSLRV